MATRVTRRRFLGLAAGATALGLRARAAGDPEAARGPVDPADAPFDTIVVLMMENRSFDHLLGWLPGTDGYPPGLTYPDKCGVAHPPWPLAPDFQGCDHLDPDHTWEGIREQYADGACDGFLRTSSARVGDLFPIGFYRESDLPILSALARGYTTFDRYFCSMMGPTWENRLYQLTGTTQLVDNCDYPMPGERRPVTLETTIFDRVGAAGLQAGYYFHRDPITGLFASGKYDPLARPIDQFWEDARRGTLANVVFVDPDYSDLAEDMGISNDYHPWGNVLVAEGLVAQVHDALKASPQWDRMVFVLNFDEHGGFFDHVPPPACEDDTVLRGADGTPLAVAPDLKRLGFRVPAIAMGPFAPRKLEKAGPYEHCSILKMIEWRWGLAPMTLRDRSARNFAEALDFTTRREAITLPAFVPPPATPGPRGGGWMELSVSRRGWVSATVEVEEPGALTCSGRLLVGDDVAALARRMPDQLTEIATAPDQPLGESGSVTISLRLDHAGLGRLAESSNVLPALLETIVVRSDGQKCRSTSPALLRMGPSLEGPAPQCPAR